MMDEQKRIFSQNLARLLSKKGVTQVDAAKVIGVSPQVFNSWMKGIAIPRVGKLERLAEYFDVYKSELLEPVDNQTAALRMRTYAAFLEKIAKLDEIDQARLDERLDIMLEAEKYHEN